MSTPVLSLLFIATILLSACGSDMPLLNKDLQSYIDTQQALAADDFPTAQQALHNLQQQVEPAIMPLVQKVAQAQDLKAMRQAFRPLSAHMTNQPIPDGLVLAYCPMVEGNKTAYWFQYEGDIMNPYFGDAMLHCGGFLTSKNETDQ